MRHALLAALSDLDERRPAARPARGGRAPGARGRRRARRTRSATRWSARPSTATCCPGERSALHARLAETVDERHELMGDAPAAAVAGDARLPLERRARRPARARRLRRGRAGSKRVLAFSEAQRHFERALELWDRVPDAEERAGCDRADVLRHAAAAAANAGEARALARAGAQGDRRGRRRRRTRCAPRSCYERLGALPALGRRDRGRLRRLRSRRWRCCRTATSPQRARLLEYRARGLVLRGRFEDGASGAAGGARDGRALRRRRRSRPARSTRSGSRARRSATIERGHRAAAPLARPRRRRGRRSSTCRRSPTSARCSTSPGRTEEALAEIEAGMEALRANPERTSYDTFMELQGVNLLIKLGRLARARGRAAGAASSATPSAPRRSSCAQLRARLALLAGDLATARAPARRVPPPVPRHARPAVDGAAARRRRRSSRCSRTARRTRATRSAAGSASLEQSQEGTRIVRLAWIGLMAEATAAERARALGEPASEADAERLLAELERARGAARPMGRRAGLRGARARRGGPAARSRSATARARPGRAGRRAVDGVRRRSSSRGTPPTRASAPPRRTCRPATARPPSRRCARRASGRTAMGVAPLLDEIDALARRARLAIASPSRAAGAGAAEAAEGARPRSSASPRASSRCCCSSPPGAPTARSARSCS